MRFPLPDLDGRQRQLAGPIEMQLPAAKGCAWHPSAAEGMVGKVTVLDFDGARHVVRVDEARVCDDPQYVWVKLTPA